MTKRLKRQWPLELV
nr:unnamed protein product [Callosobruchus analis]